MTCHKYEKSELTKIVKIVILNKFEIKSQNEILRDESKSTESEKLFNYNKKNLTFHFIMIFYSIVMYFYVVLGFSYFYLISMTFYVLKLFGKSLFLCG